MKLEQIQDETRNEGGEIDAPPTAPHDDPSTEHVEEQPADTPGNDENKDGLTGGHGTAPTKGDVLGL